jgi:hypothetical protein
MTEREGLRAHSPGSSREPTAVQTPFCLSNRTISVAQSSAYRVGQHSVSAWTKPFRWLMLITGMSVRSFILATMARTSSGPTSITWGAPTTAGGFRP